MQNRTRVAAAAAIVLLLAGAWALWPDVSAPATMPPTVAEARSPAPVQTESPDQPPSPSTAALAGREEVTPAAATATSGSLLVHLRYGDDHAPAPGYTIGLYVPGGDDPRFEGQRRRTDELGAARYEQVRPGRYYVAESNSRGKRVEIIAGAVTEIELDLDVGMTVTGIVVDEAHGPVAAAQVEVTMMARADAFPDVVAVTGADGRFVARASPTLCLIGARAAGYTASSVRFLHGKDGNTAEVELVLGGNGGSVDGVVVDGDGAPIAAAVVIVGAGELSGIGGRDGIPPFPALARSDDEGRFRAVGIPAGSQPVRVRAQGFAPWQGECEIAGGLSVPLRITLATGAVIRGVVRDGEGRAIGGAEVELGNWDDLVHFRCLSGADGTFELTGLPIGEVELKARHDDLGSAEQRVVTTSEAPSTCEFRLSRGLELKGHVVDADGKPIAEVMVECMAEAAKAHGWFRFARTDAQGCFAAANCPETDSVAITVRARGFEPVRKYGIDPKAGTVELQLQRTAPASVRIVGSVVGPDGRPVANATVSAHGRSGAGNFHEATDNDGRFDLGPYPPGAWKVSVRTRDYPEFLSEPRELAADATWDLGVVRLAIGGTAVVQPIGAAMEGVRFYATSIARDRTWQVSEDAGRLRSSAMAAGDYLLVVSGKGIAAQTVPFAISAGAETVVEVQPQAGIVQGFTCEVAAEIELSGITLRISRGAQYCGSTWASIRPGQPITAQAWLAPGEYEVTAEVGELRGSAAFTVGAAAAPPVRITLR